MKVFISWSGDQSKAIGEVLRDWIPSVLQAAKPYFSPEDVSKGARWNSEISGELESSQIGLLLLTRDNQHAPWLVFEAGALAKNLDKAKVCPILFGDLKPSDVSGPLSGFQGAPFSKDEMRRVAKMINGQLEDKGLDSSVFDTVFEKWWPDLEAGVHKSLHDHAAKSVQRSRPEREILDEMLSLLRRLSDEKERQAQAEKWFGVQQLNDRLTEENTRKQVMLNELSDSVVQLLSLLINRDEEFVIAHTELLIRLRRSLLEALGGRKSKQLMNVSAYLDAVLQRSRAVRTRSKAELDDDIPF